MFIQSRSILMHQVGCCCSAALAEELPEGHTSCVAACLLPEGTNCRSVRFEQNALRRADALWCVAYDLSRQQHMPSCLLCRMAPSNPQLLHYNWRSTVLVISNPSTISPTSCQPWKNLPSMSRFWGRQMKCGGAWQAVAFKSVVRALLRMARGC